MCIIPGFGKSKPSNEFIHVVSLSSPAFITLVTVLIHHFGQ